MGHRRDRAALLVRRNRLPIDDADRVELDATDRRDDAFREWHLDDAFVRRRQARHPSEHRREDHVAIAQARRRIAGHPEDRFPVDAPEDRGLAGLHRDPVEQEFAHRPQDVDDDVLLADGGSAREDDEIVRERFLQCGAEGLEAVRHAAEGDGIASVLTDDARHRVRVDIIHLAGANRSARRHNLVPGRENRNARSGIHVSAGHPDPTERDGLEFPRGKRVARDDSIAIHRGPVGEGHVDRRADILRGDPTEGIEDRDRFFPLNWADEIHRDVHRLLEGDERLQRPHPMSIVRPVLVIMDAGGQWPITPTACPSSGTMSFSKARRQASGDPGKQNTSRPWYTPAIAPDIIAGLPIFGYDRERKSSPNPGSVFWKRGWRAAMVTSRGASPVPPFVMIASQVQEACSTASTICFASSFTITWKRPVCPDRRRRARTSFPDSSVSGVRLSEIVMTPHFTDAGACSLCFCGTAMG